MANTPDAVEAVAAWVDGRLDLAFEEHIKSDLRRLSLEAQSQMFASPELIQPAYAEMLEPLIEQLQRGLEQGVFHDIDPLTEAQAIQGVVWASTERQWATGDCERADIREHVPATASRARRCSSRYRSNRLARPPAHNNQGDSMDLGLAGSKAVVTGGSKGMGLAIAETLAAEGGQRGGDGQSRAALDAAVESLREAGAPEAVGISVDMADAASITAGFAAVSERWGQLNSLVHTSVRAMGISSRWTTRNGTRRSRSGRCRAFVRFAPRFRCCAPPTGHAS